MVTKPIILSLGILAFILSTAVVATDLEVTPLDDFESTGPVGGPFAPVAKEYLLNNAGPNSIWWGTYNEEDWLDVDPAIGPLEPNESVIVVASLTAQADLMLVGTYSDTLIFLNFDTAEEITRGVSLAINPPGGIWVSPNRLDVELIEGNRLTEMLTLGNNGGQAIDFTIRTRVIGGSGSSAQAEGVQSQGYDHSNSAVPDPNSESEDAPRYKPGEIIVRFRARTNGEQLSTMEKTQIVADAGGATIARDLNIVPGLCVVALAEGVTVEEAVVSFSQTEGIVYAEPNYELKALSTLPGDSRFDELWGMHNTGQTGGVPDADIDAPEAWDISTGSSDILVAVIDTGIDYTHEDLAPNMWVNDAELSGTPGVDDDGNGYVDDIYGYDFVNNDGDPFDDHYHGTHCAGTVGAVGGNGQGVAGVCWNVKLMAVKFLDSGGGGWTDDAIAAVNYSRLMGAKLSSNSWGGGGYSQGLKDAIDAAGSVGMLFVAAAGNDGTNTDTYPHYPSSYDSASVVSVMSTNDRDDRSGFSNYGPISVDLGAPGSDILSCEPGNRYQYLNGTSMATPHVAGSCALLWSINSGLSNTEVKDILLRTVDLTLPGLCVSGGRLNAHSAVLETRAPWLEIEPEEGTILSGDSNNISVTFDASGMTPGIYEAEIMIISDDPCSPIKIVETTMTVNPDDLEVTPSDNFESSGTKGGPFEPECVTYTLRNIGEGPVNWTCAWSEAWLEIDPNEGVLDPNESIELNVCISAGAETLDPNAYIDTVFFENLDSNSIKAREVTLTVKPPDTFTEHLETRNDLSFMALTFLPNGSVAYYEACRTRAGEFPTDPNGSTYLSLGDDDFAEILLGEGKEILFHGHFYDRLYIGSNGYITFGAGDTQFSPSLGGHFDRPRISALFTDLTPSGNVSWVQLDDRIAVTFERVWLFGDKTKENSFQIELFFTDGRVRITWLGVGATNAVAGLSDGTGLPPVFFLESDLSEYPPCWPLCDFYRDYRVNFKDFAVLASWWFDGGCDIPYWCERTDLDFSGTTDANDLSVFAGHWLTKEDWWLEPIGRWEFEQGSGTVAYDSVGGNHGSLKGDANWAAGHIGDYALDFSGSGDGVYLDPSAGSESPLNIYNSDLTISSWVKFTGIGGTIVARSKILAIAYRMGVVNDQAYIGTYKNGPGHWTLYVDELLGSETWYNVVGVFDRSSDTGRIYINGFKEAEGAMTIDPVSNDASTKIGCRNDTGDIPFNGTIDDVRIYDRVLSDQEIQEIFQEGASYKSTNPEPSIGEVGVDPNVTVSWLAGKDALSHDVYFGIDFNDVNDANTSDLDVYMGNQTSTTWDPNRLEFETTYYWRIDEISSIGPTTGNVWHFSTMGVFDPNLGLIGWWEFEQGSGTVAYDSVGGNDGSLKGDSNWVSGHIGDYALDFDGAGDGVYLDPSAGSGSPLNIYNSDLTISSWVKFTGIGGTIVARSKILAIAYRMGVVNDQAYLGTYKNGPGHWTLFADGILDSETWYHVVGVFDRNGDTGRIYVDGVKDAEGAMTIDPYSNDASTKIGCRNDTTDTVFNGTIDDVRIYNKVLSSGEIWQIFQEGLD